MTPVTRLEEVRQKLPAAVGLATELICDNPAQFAIIASGSFCVARIFGHLVRPRTPLQALLTATAAWATCRVLLAEASSRGLLVIKVRDLDGNLVPVGELGLKESGNADPAS